MTEKNWKEEYLILKESHDRMSEQFERTVNNYEEAVVQIGELRRSMMLAEVRHFLFCKQELKLAGRDSDSRKYNVVCPKCGYELNVSYKTKERVKKEESSDE